MHVNRQIFIVLILTVLLKAILGVTNDWEGYGMKLEITVRKE